MNANDLFLLDNAEGVPVTGFGPNTPQAQVAQGKMRQLVSPMPMPDNSNMINAGQGSQAQALGMMNTPGVQATPAHGLVGNWFQGVKSAAIGNVEDKATGGGTTKVMNRASGNTNNQTTSTPQYAQPTQEQLGNHVGDGYYQLDNSYHQPRQPQYNL